MSARPLHPMRLISACVVIALASPVTRAGAPVATPQATRAATALAQAASATGPAVPAHKDVSVDAVKPAAAANPPAAGAASTPAAAGVGRVVPTPGAARAVAPYTSPVHDAATAGALGDLGLALLQQASLASGQAEVNAVVSPLSVGVAMGLVHAGAGGDTARELATLLASGPAGQHGFAARLPSVVSRLGLPQAGGNGPLAMASRLWIRKDVVHAIPAPYAALARERFGADGALLSFDDGEAARRVINQWTAEHTQRRIPQLLGEGSVTPTTKLVVTNAVHFKSPWLTPFDPKATENRPFHTAQGAKPVPTMIDERPVLQGTVDNLSVFELPFAGRQYALLLAMAPKGHTLGALQTDLAGLDMASWSSQLKESNCVLQLPKFAIAAQAGSIKPALQALGVRTLFSTQADLQPLLGKAAAGTAVDDVLHSATLVIDEAGGEAAAATAATIQAKSFTPPPPVCAIDRPFIFAVVHKPTGAPVFVGKVADPSTAPAR